jgi:diaminopimelate epimerase
MSVIPFCKFHGFGNDYIVIERGAIPRSIDLSVLAKSICHRHAGAGSDGIAVIERLEDDPADFFCEIVNPDGSVAGFSGNGTRCAVAYLYYQGLWREPALRLRTRSGVKNYTLTERIADGHYWFEAEIGKPKFAGSDVPVADGSAEPVIDQWIIIGDRTFNFSGVNVGNPVACIFVEDFDFDWRDLGQTLETHETFPERANIVFVKVLDEDNVELRIWERGAGETSASGTCSSGAAVLSAFTGRTSRTVSVMSPGGTTEVFWRDDDEILLTGRADLVYSGSFPFSG